jgi:tetratricopeptide (TPR) repeat protein
MSVVNDVLKNLNQRQAQHQVAGAAPFFYEEENNSNKWLWLGFALAMVSCSVLAGIIYMQNSAGKNDSLSASSGEQIQSSTKMAPVELSVELPAELFLADPMAANSAAQAKDNSAADLNGFSKVDTVASIESKVFAPVPMQTKPIQAKPIQAKSIQAKSIQAKPMPVKPKAVKPKPAQVIAQKTQVSKASASVVAAINSGDVISAKSNLALASRKVQEEVQLRLLLKENPKAVLPMIKRKFPNFKSNPGLLALAAQGQQRSGDHQSAVQLYSALIPLEPRQSKWRAGLAISLESLGDIKNSIRLYQLALSMDNLPMSLKRFSQGRLARLSQ